MFFIVGGFLYIFGGIIENRIVLSDMYCYEILLNFWIKVERWVFNCLYSMFFLVLLVFLKGGFCVVFSVSYYIVIVFKDCFILIIGGWNGWKCCVDLFCFDMVE